MSDGDSILGSVVDASKDIIKETIKQIADETTNSIKVASQQVGGSLTQEDEVKKKAEQAATFQRIKAIEAEMAQIAQQEAQKKGPDITPKKEAINKNSFLTSNKQHSMDEASRQAIGRTELGRNYKG